MNRKLIVGTMILAIIVFMLSAESDLREVRAQESPIEVWSDYTLDRDITFAGDGFIVKTDGVTLDLNGHTITGSGAVREEGTGVNLTSVRGVIVKNGAIGNFYWGSVSVYYSDRNTITNITMTGYFPSIVLHYSNYNSISDSRTENEANIVLDYSNYNSISRNNLTDSPDGIWLSHSSNNLISENRIRECSYGIHLSSSNYNSVVGNDITANEAYGIWIAESSNNTLAGNNITSNVCAIRLTGLQLNDCSDNRIYHNNFLDNEQQISVEIYYYVSVNVWDNGYPSGGNYWSDYNGTDSNGDGIGDTPYMIDSNNQDAYPLMFPWSWSTKRPYELFITTDENEVPDTVDPAWANDKASEELIFNVYETLVAFDGEHVDRYLPALATEWTEEQLEGVTSPEGLSWHYRYTFRIRQDVSFQNSTFGNLTPEDVEYSFERAMVQDRDGGATWMFYEPLLNSWGAHGLEEDYGIDLSSLEGVVMAGKMIDHAVESNATHVWFNLAFPGAYAPFLKILCQPQSSILCKEWMQDYVTGTLSRTNEWKGEWGEYNDWIGYHDLAVSALDYPFPVMMGTGPFMLKTLDYTAEYWVAERFADYWRGWGSGPGNAYGVGWPAFGGSKPAGYVDTVKCTWAYDWPTRATMFLNHEVDICTVPRQYIGQILNQPGIRCTYPLPSLSVEAMFYQFDIDTTSRYGPIFDYGVIGEAGIPRDFFGSASYGKYIRQAFSHCIDFDNYIQTVFLGEAMQPAACLIPPVIYCDDSIPKYNFDLAQAEALFKQCPGLWETGFTLNLLYDTGNIARKILCEAIANNVNSLNPSKFHVQAVELDWASYLAALDAGQLPTFVANWQADYPDPHSFVYPCYYTHGNLAYKTHYSNTEMDALIDEGIIVPNGPERAEIYREIQLLAVEECPNIPLAVAVGRHFEQTWVCGWYYNPVYSGVYAANLWKWYYTPHAQQTDIPANSTGNLLPYDVNYDGKTNMVDIGTTAASFGSIYGPPMSAKWVYRADFNNDRKIDMKDIGGVSKNFGKRCATWAPV